MTKGPAVVLAVLVVPIALLGALFGMGVVERWVDRDVPARGAQPAALLPRQRATAPSSDPPLMGSPEAAGQAL